MIKDKLEQVEFIFNIIIIVDLTLCARLDQTVS